MLRFGGRLLCLAACLAACGGNDSEAERPGGSAGAAGTAPQGGNAGAAAGSSNAGGGAGGSSSDSGGQTAGGAGQAGAHSGGAGESFMGGTGGGTAGAGGSVQGGAGGGSAGAGGTANATTPEMLVPTAKAFCAAARACCAKQPDPVHLDDCESAFGARDETSQMLARGTVNIDTGDLAKCKAAYEAALTSCEEVSVLAACTGIVHGTVAENGACKLGTECAGDGPKVCLVTGGQDSFGVCKATPGGEAGEECALTCRPNEVCTFTVYGVPDSSLTPCLNKDGLYCDRDQQPAKCQAVHALDAACDNDDQCGFNAFCDYDSKTCKKRSQLNEACGTCIASLQCRDGKCQSPPITVGGTCDGYSLGPY